MSYFGRLAMFRMVFGKILLGVPLCSDRIDSFGDDRRQIKYLCKDNNVTYFFSASVLFGADSSNVYKHRFFSILVIRASMLRVFNSRLVGGKCYAFSLRQSHKAAGL